MKGGSAIVLCLVFFHSATADVLHQRWWEAGNNLEERWSRTCQNSDSFSDEERIDLFSRALGDENFKRQYPELHAEIQRIVMQTPGHAAYHERKIRKAAVYLDEWLAKDDPAGFGSIALSELMSIQMNSFRSLGDLPTPETVRVLGDFMLDPWGINPMAEPGEMDYSQPERSAHAGWAMKALALLPLETRANSTPGERTKYWKDIDAWKLWYQQVKAGTRTFRFVGDPREYNLQGPVNAVVISNADRLGGPAASMDVPAAVAEANGKGGLGVSAWVLVFSCFALAAGMWRAFLRKG